MAWYYPEHVCGHGSERIQLYGKHTGRERILEAIERQPCPKCRLKAAYAQHPELPELTGSDKQVVWAAEIRAGYATHFPERLTKVATETTARWWIDHRGEINSLVAKAQAAIDSAKLRGED